MPDHEWPTETEPTAGRDRDEAPTDSSRPTDRGVGLIRGLGDEHEPDEPGPNGGAGEHKGWPAGAKRGTCKVCGDKADGPSATLCARHRKAKPDGKPRPRPTPGPSKVSTLEVELRTNLELAGQLWAMRDPFCAHVLLPKGAQVKANRLTPDPQNPEGPPLVETVTLHGQGAGAEIAKFWAERAAASATVARVLDGVVSSGGWIGGIAVHAPLVMAIYAHHAAPWIAERRREAALAGDEVMATGGPAAGNPAAGGGPYEPWGPRPDDGPAPE